MAILAARQCEQDVRLPAGQEVIRPDSSVLPLEHAAADARGACARRVEVAAAASGAARSLGARVSGHGGEGARRPVDAVGRATGAAAARATATTADRKSTRLNS